ncbi:MAG: lytic transglycosylase domain-containing protein [Chromatiales bacterium]|nr:lytic transglycosylase domain-containing protein [Chromatiales bacterium]
MHPTVSSSPLRRHPALVPPSASAGAASSGGRGRPCSASCSSHRRGAHALDPATPHADCFAASAARHRIAPALLAAIAEVESAFDPRARNRNRDGSEDIGLMQINARWLPALAAHGIDREALWQPCVSIEVGAWVLAQSIARYGYTWRAVGAYNAGTARDASAEARRMAYARRVAARLRDAGGAGAAGRD